MGTVVLPRLRMAGTAVHALAFPQAASHMAPLLIIPTRSTIAAPMLVGLLQLLAIVAGLEASSSCLANSAVHAAGVLLQVSMAPLSRRPSTSTSACITWSKSLLHCRRRVWDSQGAVWMDHQAASGTQPVCVHGLMLGLLYTLASIEQQQLVT